MFVCVCLSRLVCVGSIAGCQVRDATELYTTSPTTRRVTSVESQRPAATHLRDLTVSGNYIIDLTRSGTANQHACADLHVACADLSRGTG
jgi:hypothetical protein